jgi:flagellar protein FliS
MTLSPRDAYLETQVLTAPPQKLRLMLIEGAMRFAQQAGAYWQAEQWEAGLEANIRAREILGELMSSLDPEQSPLAKQILPIYNFVFRTLTEAQLAHDQAKLQDALRVLGEERETWRQVCEALPGDEHRPAPQTTEITAATHTAARAASPGASDSRSQLPGAGSLAFDSAAMATPPAMPGAFPNQAQLPPRGFSLEA